MRRVDLLVAGTSFLLAAACGAPQYGDAGTTAILRVECVPSCYVYVDDDLAFRAAPAGSVSLAPGSYRIALVEPGHLTARYDVTIPRRSVELIHQMWPATPEMDAAP